MTGCRDIQFLCFLHTLHCIRRCQQGINVCGKIFWGIKSCNGIQTMGHILDHSAGRVVLLKSAVSAKADMQTAGSVWMLRTYCLLKCTRHPLSTNCLPRAGELRVWYSTPFSSKYLVTVLRDLERGLCLHVFAIWMHLKKHCNLAIPLSPLQG